MGLWRGPTPEATQDYDVELSVDETLQVDRNLCFLETLEAPSLSVQDQINSLRAEICEYYPDEKLLRIKLVGTHLILEVSQAPPPNMKAVELRLRSLQLCPTTI